MLTKCVVEDNTAIAEIREVLEKIAWAPIPGPTGGAVLTGIFAVIIACLMLGLITSVNELEVPLLLWISLPALVGWLMVISAWYEHRVLRRFQERAEHGIISAGILERLALGWEQVTEIYDHTPFPWVLMLGPRPRDVGRAARLLLTNLDWYLAEPRRYINPQWVVLAGELVFFIVYFSVANFNINHVHNPDRSLHTLIWMISMLLIISGTNMWVALHHARRSKLGAEALLVELRQRIR